MKQGYIPPNQLNQNEAKPKTYRFVIAVVAILVVVAIGIGLSLSRSDLKTPEVPSAPTAVVTPPAATPTSTPYVTSAPTSTATPVVTARVYQPLSRGAQGETVKTMQKSLISLGYLNDTADGDFGNKTLGAVQTFQTQHGLQNTGVADNETLSLLYSGSAQKYAPPTYRAGMYKVGHDIPPGEYIIIANTYMPAYFALSSDSNGNDIITNSNFDYNSIITVKSGEYLEISRAYMMLLSDFSKAYSIPTDQSGTMFKVGTNLKAGEYKLVSTSEFGGYYCIYESSRQDEILANDIFENRTYVTVKNGQYLELSRCIIDN